jgi:hypothetical protein
MADSLRTVIGTTLAVGAVLTGILVLRSTRFAPAWLQPPASEPATSTNPVVRAPVLPEPPPPPPVEVASSPPAALTPSAPVASASGATEGSASAAPAPVASASAGTTRKPGGAAAARPAEPAVVELPPDFRYSPQGPGNLTFPVSPSTSSTAQPGVK